MVDLYIYIVTKLISVVTETIYNDADDWMFQF